MTALSIDAWVDAVEDYWRRHDLPARDRRRLVAELQTDLAEAVREGATEDALVARDVVVFAREVADAEGLPLTPEIVPSLPTSGELAQTSAAGAVLGAAAAWIWLTSYYPIGAVVSDAVTVVLGYTVALALVVVGAGAMVRWRYGWWDEVRRAARFGAVATLAGVVASIAPVVGLNVLLGYSTSLLPLVLLVGVGGTICLMVSRLVFDRFVTGPASI